MQREWFDRIMAHAKANYARDGWDVFYECVDFSDFKDDCQRLNLDTYEKAFEEYRELCLIKAEQREEQYAMAREGW